MPLEDDCPVCRSSDSAKERFATAKVAEHLKENATIDTDHQEWIEEHTDNGELSEIRAALQGDDGES
ncbi:MAG: hypothetical protein ABEH90_02910 [Halolamina sp.]